MSPLESRFHGANWIGLWTLCLREIRRFLKVHIQTVMAPIVTTLLFLAIFALALGAAVHTAGGVPFIEFLVPGLIMMAILQNAFANTSSSIVSAKIQGNIVDILMPPLNAGELTLGFAVGGVARGLMVGVAVLAAMSLFVTVHIHSVGYILFHATAGSLLLALLGIIGGVWADKFDHISAVTNFIVTPLSFLSGTFYSIDRLPPAVQALAHVNPFFYMIDGLRYGFIGHADAPLWLGVVIMLVLNGLLWLACHRIFSTGYKLKS